MEIARFTVGAYRENCWLVSCGDGKAVLVDPGAEAETLLGAVRAKGLELEAVLLTHGHCDHVSAVPDIVRAAPVPVHAGPVDADWAFTEKNDMEPYPPLREKPATVVADAVEGAVFSVGETAFRVLATPGHSPGGVCYLVEPEGEAPVLFSGDTLFCRSIGRTDFEGGDDCAMAASLLRLASLPPETRVLPGHGPSTTIAAERASNPWLRHLLRA